MQQNSSVLALSLRASLVSAVLIALVLSGATALAQNTASETPAALAPAESTTPAPTDVATSKPTVSEVILAKLRSFLSPLRRIPSSQQQRAVELARLGQYNAALEILEKLHQREKDNTELSRDYTTVLGWAGRDQQAVDMYDTLPERNPDYVLASVGRAYRNLGHFDKALELYRQGLKRYPDSVAFAEGEIRCMADQNLLNEALEKANADINKHGARAEIVAAKRDILQTIFRNDEQKAVELARQQAYPEAINRFHDLYSQHPDDVTLTRDYLATLDWQGGNDEQVIALFKTLPAGEQPDYVLEAVGHAYRNLRQFEAAQAIYDEGLKRYPDSVIFAEGAIRSLVDQKKYDAALAKADADLREHGQRPEIVDIKKNILKLKPRKSSKHSGKKRG